ncbi:MAG: ATP-binding protein [Pseudomonadota bacterium]|nr:ATP-binding protein [Pseudomonadota bacterium]
MRRRGLRLGTQLLLFSSVLLALPWLGYRYLEEVKSFLLQGQEEAQLLAAQAMATVLHDRSDLFEPGDSPVDALLEESALYVYPLESPIQLDGYASDWGIPGARQKTYGAESRLHSGSGEPGAALSFGLVLGERGAYLYGFLRVDDQQLVYRHPRYRRLDNSDHVRLSLMDADGRLRRMVLVTEGPGTVSAYDVEANWSYPVSGDHLGRLYGVWQEREGGYDLEFRLPLVWLGAEQRLLISVVDVNDPFERGIDTIVGTLLRERTDKLNRLVAHSPELEAILKGLERSDARICVVDRFRRVRAVLGGRGINSQLCSDIDTVSRELARDALAGQSVVLHRQGGTEAGTLIVAAYPIHSGNDVIGAVLLEKNSTHILKLQRHTLNQVILATFLVLLLVVVSLLSFGAWLAFRIRRLQRETARAIDPEGRMLQAVIQAEHAAGDELGELSRGISDILGRLNRYTGFLENVPRTLRHEILNPVNTISMSFQNLARDSGTGKLDPVINSARQATRQLERIVHSLTEAAHIEEALKGDEFEPFDLAGLVSEYVDNAQRMHPDCKFVYHGPGSGISTTGSDLRIAQLLDKIKANAVDFTTSGGEIRFELVGKEAHAVLDILNQGPPIPGEVLDSLFIGMLSHRPGTTGQPHLGIGLFIARSIATHHGGTLRVANREDVSGVRVTLELPVEE